MAFSKQLYGVDGCRGGWVVATANVKMDGFAFTFTDDLSLLFAAPESVIAIDIPIGLPEREPRACDIAARRELGQPRGSSVFPAPARIALGANTYAEALRLNDRALGVGISRQTFCITPKINEVDVLMDSHRQRYIREAHPEVTFARLNAGPMVHNKKRPEGRAERMAVLRKAGLTISDTWLTAERQRLGRGRVAPDDVLDALACLLTAKHVHTGQSQSLGYADQRDAKGLLMEIVTCSAAVRG
jgi:predicted RNase H-like nuclease